jgi:prevent-host-death family protein
MKQPARSKRVGRAGTVDVAAAVFKAKALAVMRRVHESGQPVTITSRGKPLVRIEPVRESPAPTGYGAMRGTVELRVPEDELVRGGDEAAWQTLEEWEEATRS